MMDFKQELAFLKIAENLKKEMRHSWLSNGRQESVAEHSWRLALMVMRYADRLDQPIDLQRALTMATIHDLAEAITGDIPTFNAHTPQAKLEKYRTELKAMEQMLVLIDDAAGQQLFKIWQEYEMQVCYESRYVRALDKLEAFIQHNEAPIETWGDNERRMVFQHKWLRKHCEFDSFLNRFCDEVLVQSIAKLQETDIDLDQAKKAALEEEERWLIEESTGA